jgi:hypothetical protein
VATIRGSATTSTPCTTTIGYEIGVPTLWQYITGACREIHLHVRRIPIEKLRGSRRNSGAGFSPATAKDALLEHYYAHGAFPAEG